MKARALSLAACFAVAATSTSIAQVYSVNAVGYVNRSVSPGGYCILANPLNGNPDNNLNTILPLPDEFVGASIYRFNPAMQAYRDTIQWVPGGWLATDPADLIINPGEGFFLQNVAGVPLNVTFTGEVPSGTTQNPIAGDGKYSIRSALVPRGGPLGWIGLPGSLEFPSRTGDSIFIFNCATQQYEETIQYVDGAGWLSGAYPPEGPFIEPGTGFFVQSVAPGSVVWTMTFSVN